MKTLHTFIHNIEHTGGEMNELTNTHLKLTIYEDYYTCSPRNQIGNFH